MTYEIQVKSKTYFQMYITHVHEYQRWEDRKTYWHHFSFFITDTHDHFHISLCCFIVLIKISI